MMLGFILHNFQGYNSVHESALFFIGWFAIFCWSDLYIFYLKIKNEFGLEMDNMLMRLCENGMSTLSVSCVKDSSQSETSISLVKSQKT